MATVAALSIGMLATSGGGAQAAGVVPLWNFTLDAAFDPTQTMDTAGGMPGGVSGTAGTTNPFWTNSASIFWGAGNAPPNVSGITVGKTDVTGGFTNIGPHTADGVNGPGSYFGDHGGGGDGTGLTTGNPFIPTVSFSHHNFGIPDTGPFLKSTVLQDRLVLSPFGGAGSHTLFLAFDILFAETDNMGIPAGVDDIFVISPQGGMFGGPGGDTIGQQFTFMGQDYLALLKLPVATLTDDQCTAAGAASGCKGLVTPENQVSTFVAELAIAAVPIPPAGILFVTALVGLGVIARRRKAQAA